MIRRLNYTGRKRIPTGCVRIKVIEQEPPRYEAELRLQALEFPAEARVFVDVRQGASTASRRFDFGTAGGITLPQDLSLPGFDPASLLFEVKVVEQAGDQAGRLLGISSVIRPCRPGDPQDVGIVSLLPVKFVNLHSQVWSLLFDPARPYLLLNNQIPGIQDIARTHGAFFGLVYPAVVRAILTRLVIIDDLTDPVDEDHDTWQSLWLRWAIGRHPDQQPATGEEVDKMEWIEAVVGGFCEETAALRLFLDSIDHNGAEQ